MAVAQIYTAIAGDTITAARWNNEFGNIYNNGTSIAFPLTQNVSLAGYTLTLDAAGVSNITSAAGYAFKLTPGAKSGTPNVTEGKAVDVVASTFTDTATAASGTATSVASVVINRPTFAATNTSVTTTDAATLYIPNSPANGTNNTITNPWAIWVDDGNVRFDGNLTLASTSVVSGGVLGGQTINVGLTATVSGNAITVSLTGNNGSAPSSSNRVSVPFRNSTIATGTYTYREVTAATTVTVSAGSTLGVSSSGYVRIYVVAIDNSGTVELAVWQPVGGLGGTATSTLLGVNEDQLYSTTAEGGLGAADSAQTLYSTTARSNVSVRILGWFEIQSSATAGNWGNSPTRIQVMAPGVHRTGDLIQSRMAWDGAIATGTTAIPHDNTTPLITEGDQYLSVALTPTAAANVLDISSQCHASDSAVAGRTITLNDGTTVHKVGVSYSIGPRVAMLSLAHVMSAQTTSATTWAIRGGASSGTFSFNGESGAVRYNLLASYLLVKEIFA